MWKAEAEAKRAFDLSLMLQRSVTQAEDKARITYQHHCLVASILSQRVSLEELIIRLTCLVRHQAERKRQIRAQHMMQEEKVTGRTKLRNKTKKQK